MTWDLLQMYGERMRGRKRDIMNRKTPLTLFQVMEDMVEKKRDFINVKSYFLTWAEQTNISCKWKLLCSKGKYLETCLITENSGYHKMIKTWKNKMPAPLCNSQNIGIQL